MRRGIELIQRTAGRAADLTRQLLAFSRKQVLEPVVLDLSAVTTDMKDLLGRLIGEDIALLTTPTPGLGRVKADRGQVEQVVMNLAVNARDAMPQGGRVILETANVDLDDEYVRRHVGARPGPHVMLAVSDTGSGIPREIQAQIFEPFFTTKEQGKGTGLGLATVYGIVKQSGGYIEVDSEPGQGTTFRIYLPRHIVENEEEIAQPREKKKEATRDLTGSGRVLLVEDEDVVRNFAARALARQGYEVLEAGTGVEALEVMEREKGRVDIVVSDVIMPEMDGPTLLKELRKTNPGLKFIFVSGYPDDAFKKSLDENEAYAFLPKPFTLPQLAAKVKEQLTE